MGDGWALLFENHQKSQTASDLLKSMEHDAGFASTFIFRRLNRFYQFTAIYSLPSRVPSSTASQLI